MPPKDKAKKEAWRPNGGDTAPGEALRMAEPEPRYRHC